MLSPTSKLYKLSGWNNFGTRIWIRIADGYYDSNGRTNEATSGRIGDLVKRNESWTRNKATGSNIILSSICERRIGQKTVKCGG